MALRCGQWYAARRFSNFQLGVCFSLFYGHVAVACGEKQLGPQRADGAALMVAEIRGAAHLFPHRVIAESDAANAFGSVSWAEGLELVIAKAPALAPLLAGIWQVLSPTLWLNDGFGGWVQILAFSAFCRAVTRGSQCIV